MLACRVRKALLVRRVRLEVRERQDRKVLLDLKGHKAILVLKVLKAHKG